MTHSLHQSLANGRWQMLSLAAQLGNVGSEVGRALARERTGDTIQRERALERAFELLDMTLADARWRLRLKELARTREVLADYFYGDNFYQSTSGDLDKYFYHFAYAARNAQA